MKMTKQYYTCACDKHNNTKNNHIIHNMITICDSGFAYHRVTSHLLIISTFPTILDIL